MRYKINDSDKIYESFKEIKRAAIESMLSCIHDFRLEEWNEEHLLADFEDVVRVFKCKEHLDDIENINHDILMFYGFQIECLSDKDRLIEDFISFMADHEDVEKDFMKAYGYTKNDYDEYIVDIENKVEV